MYENPSDDSFLHVITAKPLVLVVDYGTSAHRA